MSPLIVALVLGAALLHASWNAIIRNGADRLWALTVMCAVALTACIPLAFFVPLPDRASWPAIGFSSALQIAYTFFLAQAYSQGGLAQVYPIARGAAPLLVTLGAGVFVHERLGLPALAGVVLVSLGIMALAFERARMKPSATLTALAAGAFVGAYTVVDGVGSRLAGAALSYLVWLCIVQGAGMLVAYTVARGPLRLPLAEPDTRKTLLGGVLGLASYSIVIFGLSQAPMGQVSALRETSILFAALIGAVFLREKVTLPRASAALMIAAGAVVLSAGG
jgi:drug/metabolite transporter (DMT)-like permease